MSHIPTLSDLQIQLAGTIMHWQQQPDAERLDAVRNVLYHGIALSLKDKRRHRQPIDALPLAWLVANRLTQRLADGHAIGRPGEELTYAQKCAWHAVADEHKREHDRAHPTSPADLEEHAIDDHGRVEQRLLIRKILALAERMTPKLRAWVRAILCDGMDAEQIAFSEARRRLGIAEGDPESHPQWSQTLKRARDSVHQDGHRAVAWLQQAVAPQV